MDFFNTHIAENAREMVAETLASTHLSEGRLVAQFEAELEKTLSIPNLVALNSGTSALHLAMVLAGVVAGDEVILPAQTFIASGLAVKYVGAKPVFADIQYETGNIEPESIRKKITKKTKAILIVHWAGYPCDMDEIGNIASEYGLPVIEDAAHALGASYKSRRIGTLSELTCFSFQAIKHLTTGDGGGISTTNEGVARRAKKLRWFGIDRATAQVSELGERQYDADEVGFKYHMNDYAAALGLANLVGIEERLSYVRKLAQQYRNGLSGVAGIELFRQDPDRLSSHWVLGAHVEQRDNFIRKMKEAQIPVSVVHQRIDRNSVLGGLDSSLVNQARFDPTQIHFPIHTAITEADVNRIVSEVRKGW